MKFINNILFEIFIYLVLLFYQIFKFKSTINIDKLIKKYTNNIINILSFNKYFPCNRKYSNTKCLHFKINIYNENYNLIYENIFNNTIVRNRVNCAPLLLKG